MKAGRRKATGFVGSGRVRRLVAASAALVAGCLGLLITSGSAQADQPFRISFDDSEIQIGPIEGLPIQVLTEGGSIEGTVDEEGGVKIPKASFQLPVLGIEQPVSVRAFMGVEQDATGTWDPETGRLDLNTKVGIWVSIDVAATLSALQGAGISLGNLGPLAGIIGALGDLTCGFSPMNVTFTTEQGSLGSGQRFTKGLNGPGGLAVEWSQLGPFAGRTKILGFLDACTAIRSFAPTLLSGLVGNAIPGLNLGNVDIAGLLSNLDNVNLGPSALTIFRTIDESRPPELVMNTGRTLLRARPGRVARIPVSVANSGEAPATEVTVCARLPRSSRVSSRCADLGTVAAGASVSRTIEFRIGRSAKPRPLRFNLVAVGSGLEPKSKALTLRVVR